MGDSLSGQQEKYVKRLKRVAEGWRVVLLHARAVLVWEEAWHPALILGMITTAYLLLWLIEPNTLTLLASLGIVINLVDFLVPVATAHLVSPAAWTGQQEKQLEELCRGLVQVYTTCASGVAAVFSLRQTRPLMYYVVSVGVLFLLLWLGSVVNNGHLLYVVTVAASLAPGLLHRGYLRTLDGALRGVISTKKEN